MTYSAEDYAKAKKEIADRRTNAEKQRNKRHEEIILKIPEIKEKEEIMAKAGLAVIKALGMGEDAQEYIKELEKINLRSQSERAALLKKNGYPEDYLKVKHVCKLCNDKGFVNGKPCDCLKDILRSRAYERICSGLPVERCSFNDFNLKFYPDEGSGITARKRMESVFNFCKAYADDFNKNSPSLLMYGETGLGKTHMSLAIAGQAVKKGFGVIYTTSQNILNRLEKEKFGKSTEVTSTEESLMNCDLLILDDLGAEFITQFTISCIYNIINTRLLASKPVIISTNLTPNGIEEKYSQRIASRILSSYTILKFDGSDIRQLKTR